jgi:stage V sporulation protein R
MESWIRSRPSFRRDDEVNPPLANELETIRSRIEGLARSENLDFYPVVFEMIDYDQMSQIAAYGGFPTRYPHWRFGMDYERLAKSHRYGLSKIYELVVNTDPVYAYLLTSNSSMDQKLVMAHVYGHADFFKNNIWFSHTNRKMLDQTANHATKIRRHIETHGLEKVETFIDACLSLEDLIDAHSLFIKRRASDNGHDAGEDDGAQASVKKLKSKDYMDSYVNPKDFLESQEERLQEEMEKKQHFPIEPEKDVLLFLIEHAPIERWQRDVLSIIREEAYYFAPQGQTKIMNEGWASYWHSKLMTEKLLTDPEVVDYADHHAGTMSMQPGRLNPYKIGLELFRDIKTRYDQGRFGKEYDECDDYIKKESWDLKLGQGREKIFQVRQVYNDVTFIDTFLTEEFCREQKLFTFARNDRSGADEIQSREFKVIKSKLLTALTNGGKPFLYVQDGNFGNRGELCLHHRHDGPELQKDYAEETLKNLAYLWGRPVHVETKFDDTPTRLSCDGDKITEEEIETEI